MSRDQTASMISGPRSISISMWRSLGWRPPFFFSFFFSSCFAFRYPSTRWSQPSDGLEAPSPAIGVCNDVLSPSVTSFCRASLVACRMSHVAKFQEVLRFLPPPRPPDYRALLWGSAPNLLAVQFVLRL